MTVKGYARKKTTSVSYGGQIARHTLHDSLKKLATSGNGKPNLELKAKMMFYYAGQEGRALYRQGARLKLLIDKFGVKARNNDVTGDMKALMDSLGNKASAEND